MWKITILPPILCMTQRGLPSFNVIWVQMIRTNGGGQHSRHLFGMLLAKPESMFIAIGSQHAMLVFILCIDDKYKIILQKAHVDLIVQVPQDRRHSFNRTLDTDLFPHIVKVMKHISKYQVYRQQVGQKNKSKSFFSFLASLTPL